MSGPSPDNRVPDNDSLSSRIVTAIRELDESDSDHDLEAALDVIAPESFGEAAIRRIMRQVNLKVASEPPRPVSDRISIRPVASNGSSSGHAAMIVACAALLVVAGITLYQVGNTSRPLTAQRQAAKPHAANLASVNRRVSMVAPESLNVVQVGDRLVTGAKEKRRVNLPDGSILSMNELTQVTVAAARRVKLLSGEVYVEVVPRKATAPSAIGDRFVVETPNRQVTALGTKFFVKSDGPSTNVVVTQGSVRVSGVAQVLAAGQELIASRADSDSVELRPAKRSAYVLEWVKDLLAATGSAIVPTSEHAGGTITVVDPQGQQIKMSLRKFHIDVHIEDGFARTTIDQTYFNHTWQQLEGTFRFPLPADASLSRLAMYVNGTLMEGGMVERDHGRNVFEQIRHTRRDPALLEWVDGSTFQMRVFPLEARQEKRILLSYTQRLPVDYGKSVYRFPAGHNLEGVREWSTMLRVKGRSGSKWYSPSHLLNGRDDLGDLVLEGREDYSAMDRDLVVELGDRRQDLASESGPGWSTYEQDGFQYAMLRWRPSLQARTESSRRHWVFLVENSADRNDVLAETQRQILKVLLDNIEHRDTFSLVRAGTSADLFRDKPVECSLDNAAAAVQFLEQKAPIGALDLGQGLDAVQQQSQGDRDVWIVHLGTGIPVLGERDQTTLSRRLPVGARYVGVAVGKRWSKSFMETAATRSGGHVTQINPDETVAWRAFDLLSTLNAARLTGLAVQTTEASDPAKQPEFLLLATSLAHGQEFAAVTRVAKGVALPKSLTVTGTLNGKPFSQALPVPATLFSGGDQTRSGHLPRTWARLEIDRLVSLGAVEYKQQIIDLSKAMYVMSPFTSLLVLETEQMYAQFNVDRGRKDHWAMYPAPAQIPVVSEIVVANRDPLDLAKERKKQLQQRVAVAKDHHERGKSEKRSTVEIGRLEHVLRAEEQDLNLIDAEIARLEQAKTAASDPAVIAWESVIFRREVWNGLAGYQDYYRWANVNPALKGLSIFDGEWSGPGLPFETRSWAWSEDGASHELRWTDLSLGQAAASGPAWPVSGPAWVSKFSGVTQLPGLMTFSSDPARWSRGLVNGGDWIMSRTESEALGRNPSFWRFRGIQNSSTVRLLVISDGATSVISGGERFDDSVLDGTWSASSLRLFGNNGSRRYQSSLTDWYGLPQSTAVAFDADGISPILTAGSGRFLPALESDFFDEATRFGTFRRSEVGQSVPGYLPYTVVNQHPLAAVLKDLPSSAPGLQTWQADRLAVVEESLAKQPERGDVDPEANRLIEKARSLGWQKVRLVKDVRGRGLEANATLIANGDGRFVMNREVGEGLRETVINDGQTLWHLYPEIGLGAKRTFSRFHQPSVQALIPWYVPSAEHLSVGADLKTVGDRSIRITRRKSGASPASPKADIEKGTDDRSTSSHELAIELVFAEEGQLMETRVIDVTAGTLLASQSISSDGTVRITGAKGKLLAERQYEKSPADVPNLVPITNGLVVLPLPYRSLSGVPVAVPVNLQSNAADYSKLNDDEALMLLATYFAEARPAELAAFIEQRFAARGDHRVGLAVLLASVNPQAGQLANEWQHHRQTHLGKFLEQYAAVFASGSLDASLPVDDGESVFLNRCSLAYLHYSKWATDRAAAAGRTDEDVERDLQDMLTFVRECRSLSLAYNLMMTAEASLKRNNRLTHRSARLLNDVSASLAAARDIPSFCRTSRIGWLMMIADEASVRQAGDLFKEFLLNGIQTDQAPDLTAEVRDAFVKHYQTAAGQTCGPWADLIRAVVNSSEAKDHPVVLMEVARRCVRLKELGLGAEVYQLVVTGRDLSAESQLNITVLEYAKEAENWELAEACIQRAFADARLQGVSSVWRDAATISHHLKRDDEWIQRLEKAYEIEFAELPAMVNLETFRQSYEALFNQLEERAGQVADAPPATKLELARTVQRAANRWRQIDDNDTSACHRAARILGKLGLASVAWDYWTAPLAEAPDQSSAWVIFANVMNGEHRFVVADQAWSTAFECEPTNPDILLQHAQFLRVTNQEQRARELLTKITSDNWQPRFEPTKAQAQTMLTAP